MTVLYENGLWEFETALRENLFLEVKDLDPTRLCEIKRNGEVKIVQICELKTLSENRLN